MKTSTGFEIKFVFLAYIPPYDEFDAEDIELKTEIIKNTNKTTDYLFRIFNDSIDDAKVEITFNSDDDQNNEIRSMILGITQKKTIAAKTTIAKALSHKLYEVTDGRNGTGLFIIIEGQKEQTTRIILLRLKGDEGLVNNSKRLLVDYISEVFTKRSNHYKLAVYEDILSPKSFWKGYAVDKQVSSNSYKSLSVFWIESFLQSQTALTSAQGTLHLTKVLKTILSKTPDLEDQEEIISGIVNLKNKANKQISIAEFCNTYLSERNASRIRQETNEQFYNSVFIIDSGIYRKEFGKTVLSLKDGVTIYVPTFNYKELVQETINNDGSRSVKIEGRVTSKKINVQQNEKVKK